MRYILSLLLAVFLSSCSTKSLPPINFYNISSYESLQLNSPYKNKILKVSYPLSIGQNLGYKIYYEYKNGENGYYLNSQWQNSLDKEIYANLIKALEASNIFKAVVPFESSIEEDLRLESTIYEFKYLVDKDSSFAVVKIEFILEDMNNRSILKRKIFSYRQKAKKISPKAYVEALNEIFKRLDRDLIEWIVR